MHEAVSVSGELQGGVLVEPRGSAGTFEEAGEYRQGAIALLDRLRSDIDTSVADAATSSLIEAIHPLIDDPFVGDALFDVLAQLSGPSLVRLRTHVTSLIQMQRSHGAEPDTERLITKLENLDRALPAASDLEAFFLLLQLRPWDLDEDQLLARIRGRLRVFENKGELNRALALLEEQVTAAWFVGRALAEIKPDDETLLRHLTGAFDMNPAALAGYLDGMVNQGVPSAFDDFLAGPMAGSLSDVDRLSLAVRGPATEDAKARIMAIVGTQPVAVGVRHLFIWQRDLKEEEVATLVSDWAERVQSQDDYNSLIDWLNFGPPDQARPEGLREPTYKLLLRRKDFPAMGQQGWDWNQLAKTFTQQHGDELAKLVLDLVEQGQLVALSHNPESEVLIESAEAFPEQVWNEIASRLSGESWRIELEIRGWLLHAIPSEIVQSWVGDAVERARTVAAIAPVGTDEPTSIARFLLERFADDQAVAGHLWGNFMSGTWMGTESDRLTVQIEQLNGWRKREESAGVRKWAGEVVQGLEARRHEALEREAEKGY